MSGNGENPDAKPEEGTTNGADVSASVKQEPEEPKKPAAVNNDEDEEDPLDAYMKTMTSNRSSSASLSTKSTTNVKTEPVVAGAQKKVVTIITSVVKSSNASGGGSSSSLGMTTAGSGTSLGTGVGVEKGAIMEQGEDALEFLSDDELAPTTSEPNFEEMHIDQLPKIKTKSEQVSTDHSKVYYRPFRKNFYVEVPELAKMTQAEVEAFREELEGIKVISLKKIYY